MRLNFFVTTFLRVAALAIAVVASCGIVAAQDYPNRPVRLIVAFAPGGATDFTARIIADRVQGILGQPIAVENKPGANGAIGAEYVAKSDPDGYTLFFTTVGAVAINPALRPDLPYDPLKDFAAVGKAAVNSTILVVNADMKINSARELAELARRKPGSITIGITGRGAISDLGRQLFEDAAGIKLQEVPYRGAAPAITDILAGHLDGLFGDVPTIMGQVQAGKLKALAATSTERSDIFPEVPTFVEQGFAGVVGDNWAGVLAPAGTPAPVIAKFNAALVTALNEPDLRSRLHNAGVTPAPSTPEQFETYLREENARWGKIIRDKGIKGE
ncbi:MAG TPA: tripartite tricarboxylate transporter substrate binding protein [Xanthobacteraceae bacterium]|jgi:tripartite-type tricarboxylate transporter receptor subunit TctC|nr:tripartite tricarboxylate transporter substrate binding protein [Xanthobacteraceae bacterium]